MLRYRTSLAVKLADEIDALDPTDILVLNQEVLKVEFGFNCVDISVRVLGSTRKFNLVDHRTVF